MFSVFGRYVDLVLAMPTSGIPPDQARSMPVSDNSLKTGERLEGRALDTRAGQRADDREPTHQYFVNKQLWGVNRWMMSKKASPGTSGYGLRVGAGILIPTSAGGTRVLGCRSKIRGCPSRTLDDTAVSARTRKWAAPRHGGRVERGCRLRVRCSRDYRSHDGLRARIAARRYICTSDIPARIDTNGYDSLDSIARLAQFWAIRGKAPHQQGRCLASAEGGASGETFSGKTSRRESYRLGPPWRDPIRAG